MALVRVGGLVGGVVAAVVATLLVAPVGSADPEEVKPIPELGPLISGTHSYVGGTYVWTDYAYDDRGANSNGVPGGDTTYPADAHPANTADLIQLQLGVDDSGALSVTAVLNSLVEGYEAVVGVGVDVDGDPATGAPEVPGGGWTTSAPLGLEQMVVLDTLSTGRVLTWEGDDWQDDGEEIDVRVDRARNVLSATVGALAPGAATWRVVGVIGTADDGGSWVDGTQPIFDLAFVRAEDPPMEPAVAVTYSVPQIRSPWQDEVQADILSGMADAAVAVASVEFGSSRTAPAVPEAPTPEEPALETFLYHSRVDLGEGIRRTGSLQYRGVYQPYVVLIPYREGGLGERPPGVVFLHGANQNHLINAVHFSRRGVGITGSYDVPAVVIFPHGRDTGWSTGPAEKDLLDATDDAIARLNLDADRIVLSGISAGGIGTFRHVARHPDRWTGGYSIVGSGTAQLENLTNVPFRAHNGALDPLVNAQAWSSSAIALAAAETVDYRTVLVHTQSHVPVPMGNCWYLDLLSRPRERNPARVRYTLPPPAVVDATTTIRPNAAYWVSGLEARGDGLARVDALSAARPARAASGDIDQIEQNLTQGADFCGPNPDVQTGDNWTRRGRMFEPADTPLANTLTATLTGLSRAVLDLARAGLALGNDASTVHLDADGPGTVTLTGLMAGNTVLVAGGESIPVVDGRAAVGVQSGMTRVTILPPQPDGDGDGIPDTPPPTSTKDCAGQGWRRFNNPTFSNAKECRDHVASGG